MTSSPRPPRLSCEAASAVETACSRQLEDLLYRIEHRELTDLPSCLDALSEWQVDECLVVDLDLNDQLSLVEEYADEYGLDLNDLTLDTLRSRIEGMAAYIIGHLGAEQAVSAWESVEELLEELDLPLDAIQDANPFGMWAHYAEREEGVWQVYEYRNLEGEGVHADIFEYRVAGITFCVRQWLDRGTRSPEEEAWDAS